MVFFTVEIATYVATCLAAASFVAFIVKRIFSKSQNSPPGPFQWPVLGNAWILTSKEPHKTFLELTRRHGPIFTIAIGPIGIVCLTKYNVIKEALVKRGDIFAGRPRLYAMGASKRGHHGIVMTDGEGWRIHRRFASQTLKEFGVGRLVMEDKILLEVENLKSTLKEHSVFDKGVNLTPCLELCVSNILADLIFGRTFEKSDQEFQQFLHSANESFQLIVSLGAGLWETFPFLTKIPYIRRWIGFEKLMRLDEDITFFIQQQMRKCEERWSSDDQSEVRDFATAFLKELQRRRDLGEIENPFNERQWLGVVNDLWMAGTETTTTELDWAFFYMCLYPEIQNSVQQEIETIIGKERSPRLSDKISMPYTQAVLCECLRFANILPYNLLHRVQEDTKIAGYHIAGGTWVLPQICAVLWDPDVFPNPDRFDPSRFLDDDGRLKTIEEFIPFGIGKRSCLGDSLAKAEMFLVVTSLLQIYTFGFAPDQPTPSTVGVMGLTKRPSPYQCLISAR